MKYEVMERIKSYVDSDIFIEVIFYTDVECGGQYGGVVFDSRKGSIKTNDNFLTITTNNTMTFIKWENIICVNIRCL